MENELDALGLVSFIKSTASRGFRWCNFLCSHSQMFPIDVMQDHKAFHYKHNVLKKPLHVPTYDIHFCMRPEHGDYDFFSSQCTEIFNFVNGVLRKNGFHCRPFYFSRDGQVVAVVFRIFRDRNFHCTLHTEYLEGKAKGICPVCGTEVIFGKFHPPKGKVS